MFLSECDFSKFVIAKECDLLVSVNVVLWKFDRQIFVEHFSFL